jgi:hypothetical protein
MGDPRDEGNRRNHFGPVSLSLKVEQKLLGIENGRTFHGCGQWQTMAPTGCQEMLTTTTSIVPSDRKLMD